MKAIITSISGNNFEYTIGRKMELGVVHSIEECSQGTVYFGYSEDRRTLFAVSNSSVNKVDSIPPPINEPTDDEIEAAAKQYLKPFAHQLHLGGEQSVMTDFIAGVYWYREFIGRN